MNKNVRIALVSSSSYWMSRSEPSHHGHRHSTMWLQLNTHIAPRMNTNSDNGRIVHIASNLTYRR
jgi:hypothetical protein